jgi:predicted AAA+ superfamily ATPase
MSSLNEEADLNDVADYEMAVIDRKDDNFNEVHSKLHPDLKFVLNSINLLIGRPSSGKSRFVFHEISKLKYIPNPYSQFIYVSDEENDKTYLKYKDLINIPIGRFPMGPALQKEVRYRGIDSKNP